VPNMLVYPDLLANLTANLTDEIRWWKWARDDAQNRGVDFKINVAMDQGLALESFDPSRVPQPLLGASPGFLSTNYICQVPRTKSAGMLFVSILVADLVLLQAVWLLFRFVVDTISQQKYPPMRYCAGCSEDTELMERRNSSSTAALIHPSSPRGSPVGEGLG